MYIPQQFEVTDKKEIVAFIKESAFGQLISTVNGRLFSSHVPFFLSQDSNSLICHVAKHNPQWEDIEGQEVLVTFQGSHDYVSPSWYNSSGVPTWNYQTVNVYGKPQLVTETEKLKNIVNELTGIHESSFDKPWKPEYKDSMLTAIIGIEIKITEFHCQYKLSQNRSKSDRTKVADEFQKRGSVKLSRIMKIES